MVLLHPCHCNFLLKSRSRTFFLILFGTIVLVTYVTYQFQESTNGKSRYESKFDAYEQRQYKESKRQAFVVDTPTCKIPEMDPFDSTIRSFVKPGFGYPIDCKEQHRSWTYLNGNELVLNVTAIHESGYSTNSIHCCYRIIERVEQPIGDWDKNADNYVKYSEKCHPITFNPESRSSLIDAEFIRVHCISKAVPLLNDVVYRDFFAIAQPHSDRLVSRKLFDWNRKAKSKTKITKDYHPPPNVVIIGIDNNSRMNSQRHLQNTLSLLRKIGAVELLGYTKVGENTFPNSVAFLSGRNDKQIEKEKSCRIFDLPQDECPYVWKLFETAGYITVHAEDSPYLGGFNYLKKGFLRKPADFYIRTLMLAVMTYMPRFDYYHTDCIGRYMTNELVFNYITDIIKLSNSQSAPVFVHSWLTSLAHYNYNNIQFEDGTIAKFIQSLVNVSNDNTVFFFMSDHGQRYGPIRETTQGWYEDKLPTQWVYLPQHLRRKFPEWDSSLKINSGRLTSHFDIYKTLLHILKEYDEERQVDNLYKDLENDSLKGQSLFEVVPENRKCEDAGITVNFCACSKPSPIDINDKKVKEATEFAVKHLAKSIPLDVCDEPKLKKIVSAGFLSLLSKPTYLIVFITDPGDFLFEVNVEVVKGSSPDEGDSFVISTDFLRMNKITRSASCVSDPLLERYCYCK